MVEGTNNYQQASIKYRPDIDGLRAIAIILVVGFHAFPEKFQSGFLGVDIFYVVSGYLISSIIFEKLEKNNFSLIEFYSRRIRRIFPALILVMSCVFIGGWYVLLADEFLQLGKHLAASSSFISNFILWKEIDYFDSLAITKPFLHLWSLAIEEQFYIFWPLVLCLIWKRKTYLLNWMLIFFSLSFLLNIYVSNSNTTAAFYSPFTRFWELLIGGILAYQNLKAPTKVFKNPNRLSLSGGFLIAFGLFLEFYGWMKPGLSAFLPTLGVYLVISAGPNSWINYYFLSNRLFVWLGLISYPLYLWHWPLLSYGFIIEGQTPTTFMRIALVFVSIVLAGLTKVLVEQNLRHNSKSTVVIVLSFLMILIFIVGTITYLKVIPPRNSSPEINRYINAVSDWESFKNLEPFKADDQTFYVKKASNEGVLFFGDSHVEQYAPRIDELLNYDNKTKRTAYFATRGGVPPIPSVFNKIYGNMEEFRNTAINFALSPKIQIVVIGGYWNNYMRLPEKTALNNSAPSFYFLENGNKIPILYGTVGRGKMMVSLELLLKKLSATKKVYLLLDNPHGDELNPKNSFSGNRMTRLVVKNIQEKLLTRELTIEEITIRNELIGIASRTGAIIIDPIPTLCPNGKCIIQLEDGEPVYKDNDHLRPFFVRKLSTYIDEPLLMQNN